MNTSTWKLRLLTGWDEISAPEFVHHWTALMEKSDDAHVFFHPVIVQAWFETYRPLRDIRPLFVHAVRGEQEVIFPLVLWRRNWKNGFILMIVPAGYSDFDYHDPLFRHKPDTSEIKSFYEALQQKLDADIAYDRMLLDGLHRQYLPPYGSVVKNEACLTWPLKDAVCENNMLLPVNKHLASELRRRLRRLSEQGEVAFHQIWTSDENKLMDSLFRMLESHKKRWPNAYKAPYFHQNLVVAALNANLIDFIELAVAGKPIAWRICFKYKQRYSLYMPANCHEYTKYSPGHLSLCYALCRAKKEGMLIIDHLRGAEEYKNAWGGEETMIYDVAYDTKNILSALRRLVHKSICKADSTLKDAGH
jgi:CelD/BcsL family acetyltransferase involved in cellulose biosynthesis